MVRAEGLEPPHLSTTGPKPAASTNSATRADAVGGAAYNRDGRLGNPQEPCSLVPRRRAMQQHPPPPEHPEQPPEPSQPGQPSEPPPETPVHTPDIDVPVPPSPRTDPTPGPISPVG